jgi:hypothetical protein
MIMSRSSRGKVSKRGILRSDCDPSKILDWREYLKGKEQKGENSCVIVSRWASRISSEVELPQPWLQYVPGFAYQCSN